MKHSTLQMALLSVLYLIIFSLGGCSGCNGCMGCCWFSKDMTDGEFMAITSEAGLSMMKYMGDIMSGKIDEGKLEDLGKEELKKACDKRGFSLSDYECKAKKLGKRMEDAYKPRR